MNKNKLQIWLPFLISIAVTAGIFIGFRMNNNLQGRSFFANQKTTALEEVLELIKNRYVDDVDLKKISDSAIQQILSKLDPHSVLIPAEELEEINNEIEGNFYGIGIEFDMIDDTLNIITVMKDGPASKAGLMTGDKILKAGGKSMTGKNYPDDSIRKIIKGDRGTSMKLAVLRGIQTINIEVERELVPVSSIDASYMVNKDCGYLRINKFSTQTHREFMFALEDLKNKGMKKLILDLRDNGGGILDEAVEIADEFLDGDKLITYTEGKHMPKKEYRCKRTGQFEKGGLVVLSNEGSASASEVLMGALQDWDRAIIIGTTSFGKGLVQEQYDLSDKSAVRLTVARYYSPTGRCIQRSYVNGEKSYYDEIKERVNGELHRSKTDSSKFFKTAKGKLVYGGGGITPDILMKEDSSFRKTWMKLHKIDDGFELRKAAYRYFLNNKHFKTNFKNIDDYVKDFQIPDDLFLQFRKEDKKDSLDFQNLTPDEVNHIKNNIKAVIARIAWGNSAYYNCVNANDSVVLKASEIVSH